MANGNEFRYMGTCSLTWCSHTDKNQQNATMATSIIKSPLANITQDFWRVSLAYRKRAEGSNSLTVIQAIRLMNNLLNNSGEHRLLHRRALYLQHYIICGEELTNEEKGTDKA